MMVMTSSKRSYLELRSQAEERFPMIFLKKLCRGDMSCPGDDNV